MAEPSVASSANVDFEVQVVDNSSDFAGFFRCAAAAFGHQINDSIWTGMNPGWDTPAGLAQGAARLAERWRTSSQNGNGDPNTIFLKVAVRDPESTDVGRIVGAAIWAQMSVVPGQGEPPLEDDALRRDVETMHPNNETEQRFLYQMMRSLLRRRAEVISEKKQDSPPAVMVLDLCAVDPAFQRKGIALKLVQWGLKEAKRRGLEATTEASSMGRHVYTRLGFSPEGDGSDLVFDVDEEFAERPKPPNVFLRTGWIR